MASIEIRAKQQSEAIVVVYDFTDFLLRNGADQASYVQIIESGLTVYKAVEALGVVRLTIGDGIQGGSYTASVRATLLSNVALTITVSIYIARSVFVENINTGATPIGALELALSGGLLLADGILILS